MPQKFRRSYDLHSYVHAHQHAFAWAEKALLFRSADKSAQAIAAVDQARKWLRIIKELEPQGDQECISLTVTRLRVVVSKSFQVRSTRPSGAPRASLSGSACPASVKD